MFSLLILARFISRNQSNRCVIVTGPEMIDTLQNFSLWKWVLPRKIMIKAFKFKKKLKYPKTIAINTPHYFQSMMMYVHLCSRATIIGTQIRILKSQVSDIRVEHVWKWRKGGLSYYWINSGDLFDLKYIFY